ncbi:MAG: TM0996/MTH895 family glutaredoxin-like protein [Phycisphaerae bacterium]|nr:thioredoxin family protein [Phycisphaerae bacterium]NUQ46532.1 TM0996/MTH895 family glutaredoxin-like protein [Phycisphaerae bacterium]
MKIEILGTGCAKCDLLEQTARAAADKLGVPYQLVHVQDINEFVRRGVIFTPALILDGKVVAAGKVPAASEISRMLSEAAAHG